MPSPDGPLRSRSVPPLLLLLLPRLRAPLPCPRASSRRGITVTHWMRAAFLWTILISRTPRRMTEMRRMQRTGGGGRWEQTRTTPDPGALEPGRCLLTHACVSSQHDARAPPPPPVLPNPPSSFEAASPRLSSSVFEIRYRRATNNRTVVNWIMTLTRSLSRRSTIA